jgi:hypothetical protein
MAKGESFLRWLPTFVGIGSMRCGSTWLYEVLKCHPDVRVSSAKEMDFFFMRPMLTHDVEWYARHFAPRGDRDKRLLRGEISPRYARLKPWHVKQIANWLPDLRILLTIRHPIERVWSQTLFDFGRLRGRDVRRIGLLEILRQIERPRSRLSSDYYRTINTWARAFGAKALRVDLFDDLRNDPNAYVNGVLRHIGATVPWTPPEGALSKKVLATKSLMNHEPEIPEVAQWYIANQWLDATERLNQLLDGRVSTWVEEMRAIRGQVRPNGRLLRELNRILVCIPERVAYNTFHMALDVRLWLRWRHLASMGQIVTRQVRSRRDLEPKHEDNRISATR